jgi:predicted acetyltransferase
MKVMTETLPERGIGMVSVHPYARSCSHMKTLMNIALEDMQQDGLVFSCPVGSASATSILTTHCLVH